MKTTIKTLKARHDDELAAMKPADRAHLERELAKAKPVVKLKPTIFSK
jgi:hypothetical protein